MFVFMQAAWSAGALQQALTIPFIQSTLVSACTEELLQERVQAKKQQLQQVGLLTHRG